MKQDLTTLLCAVPFVPFTVKTRDGEMYTVDSIGRMCVGNDTCAFVDAEGSLLAIPFHNIDKVSFSDYLNPSDHGILPQRVL